jgi:hypothetical protein
MRRPEIVRIRDALLAQRAQLVAALGDDLVFVRRDGGLRLGRFGHDGRNSEWVRQRKREGRRDRGAAPRRLRPV